MVKTVRLNKDKLVFNASFAKRVGVRVEERDIISMEEQKLVFKFIIKSIL